MIQRQHARRPETLDGKVLGLLDNGKHNGNVFLSALAELIGERYLLSHVVTIGKADATRVAPPDLLTELQKKADVVITAIGD